MGAKFVGALWYVVNGVIDEVNVGIDGGCLYLSGATFVEALWYSGNGRIDEINGLIGGLQSTISIAVLIGA